MTEQTINGDKLMTPKEAFDLGVQMEMDKRRRILIAEQKANRAYQNWLWNYLEINQV